MSLASILLAALVASGASAPTAAAAAPHSLIVQTEASRAASTLAGVEDRISEAHLRSLETNDPAPLVAIIDEIRALNPVGSPDLERYRRYWAGYGGYVAATEFMRLQRMDEARGVVTNAVADLEAIPTRDAEVNALYGLVGGFNLAFVPRQEMMDHVGKVSTSLGAALSADGNNVRALYANALSDMGTPKEFGGGTRAEALLRQAVAVPATTGRPLRPDWGHDMAAAFLIQLLLKDGKQDEAAAFNTNLQRDHPGSVGARMVAARFTQAD